MIAANMALVPGWWHGRPFLANPNGRRGGGNTGHHVGYVNGVSGVSGETTLPNAQDATGIATGSDGALWFSTFEVESIAPSLDRLPDLFGTVTEAGQGNLNLGQLLADSDLGFWYVRDTGDGASLYRVTSDNILTDEANAPIPAHGSDCYSKTNLRACPLDGLAFGPNRAIWFTDFSTNSIGVFPTGYAPLPEVSGPAGPEGKAGAEGKAGLNGNVGPEGKAGLNGNAGPEGKAGTAGVNAPTTIVIVPFQTTVTASSVTVHYALTGAAKVTLSVTAGTGATTAAKANSRDLGDLAKKTAGTSKGPVVVATSKGKVGSDTITWNRELSGKHAKAGTYTLTLQASAGTAQAKATEKVRLSSH
jgi:hypothetical protein